MTYVEVISDRDALHALTGAWDLLAAQNGLPLMSADQVAAWWRHMAPLQARARVVAVRDGDALVGLAPFYVQAKARGGPVEYLLPGAELGARIAPLAIPGRERDVAAAIAQALESSAPRPDLIVLECLPASAQWAEDLRALWPGSLRPRLFEHRVETVPVVTLHGNSYDSWFASKSSNFRSQMRRLQRRFAGAGGVARLATVDTIESDVATFMRLHTSRWATRGGSNLDAVGDRLTAMLGDLGATHLEDGRFRLWLLELGGEPICAQLFNAIGRHVTYLNGGWDERFAQHKPPMLSILHAIEEAFARGDSHFDLGPGDQPYKQRFADRSESVSSKILMAPGRRLPATWLRTAPRFLGYALRDHAKRRLSPEHLRRARMLRQRLRVP